MITSTHRRARGIGTVYFAVSLVIGMLAAVGNFHGMGGDGPGFPTVFPAPVADALHWAFVVLQPLVALGGHPLAGVLHLDGSASLALGIAYVAVILVCLLVWSLAAGYVLAPILGRQSTSIPEA